MTTPSSASLNAQLNPEQRAAVEHIDGPMLVLAGAGSGKTRVITYRISHLVASGIVPEQIVAVSFTNKAASEMRVRVSELLGSEISRRCQLSTFHSLGAEILRQDISALGYKTPFSILDANEQRGLLKRVLEEMRLKLNREQLFELISLISRAKMAFTTPNKLPGMRFNPLRPRIQTIFERYVEGLRTLNSVDFDDLIALPVLLFQKHPDILEGYHKRWHYVMVDEYQDTNHTQFMLLEMLAAAHKNVVVVGDDDQSIYGFRGADSEHILSFEKHFPGARVVALEQNYRSTKVILEAANAVIANNSRRREKALWSSGERGEPLKIIACKDEREEALFIADDIQRRCQIDDLNPSDFAILYRIHPQARILEEVLRERRVPFRIVGGTSFFDRAEVRDVIHYLRACLNPRDEMALCRVVNTPPRGIGPRTMAKVAEIAEKREITFLRAMDHAVGTDPTLRKRTRMHMRTFVELIDRFHKRLRAGAAASVTAEALLKEIHYLEHLRNSEVNYRIIQGKIDSVEELINALATFEIDHPEGSLAGFLERVALEPPEPTQSKHEEAVTMMTFHAAKGLEFPVVYMVGCEQGLLPHERSRSPAEIEEERRLCYVGITRAREKLILTFCRARMRHGKPQKRTHSPFLEEIPESARETLAEGEGSIRERLNAIHQERDRSRLDALKAAIYGD